MIIVPEPYSSTVRSSERQVTGTVAPIGRKSEIAKIEGFLDHLPDGSRTVLLEGEVGIGKTTLIDWGRDAAQGRGLTVLSARPVEAEFPLEFAGLADLLEGAPGVLIDTLPAPQRQAVRVAVLRDELPESLLDPRTIATAVLTMIRALATTAPVVLVVDDLPWLDVPSAKVLSFVLRRAGAAPVGLLGAVRTDWSGERPPILALDHVDPDRIETVCVGPISADAMRALMAARTGIAPGPSQLLRLHRASGGNPLFAIELAAGAASSSLERTERTDTTMTVPRSLRDLVLDRVNAHSESERDVLLVTALASDPTVTLVRATTTNQATTIDDLDTLIRTRVLVRNGDDLAFVHPLIRSVVTSEARPAARRAAHRRLAAVESRTEARARHLALGTLGQDETVASELESAAMIAGARGACDTAAELAELALSRTTDSRPEDWQRRTSLAADFYFDASDLARAITLLESIVNDVERGPGRAELLRRLARYRSYRGEPLASWAKTLLVALDEAGDDMALRATVLLDLGVAASNEGDQGAAAEYATSALDLAERSGNRALEAQLLAGQVWSRFLSGEGVRHDLIDRALQGPEAPVRLAMELRPNVVIAHVLHFSGDLDGARSLYEKEYTRARDEGIETGLPMLLWGLVLTEVSAGNWYRAEQLATEGYELAAGSEGSVAILFMSAVRSLVHVCQGQLDEGRTDGRRSLELARAVGLPLFTYLAAYPLGLAELSCGNYEAAHELLAPFEAEVSASGVAEPALFPFLPDAVEALVRLGKLEAAAELLTPFEAKSVELGRAWGIAVAGRCHGLLLAASGDLPGAEAALASALEVLRHLPLPFEHARTLLTAGEVHRRARHKSLADGSLREALAIFDDLGAPLWAQRTRAELDRLGIRRSPEISGLTATERSVADLVGTGLTNAQVAAQLFMSKRTVEAHLSRVFRKLGVRSRTEMSRIHLPPATGPPPASGTVRSR